mgnify:CR=1 FL=1
MKHAKELKIGVFVIVILTASFFLINYLRGEDIFNRENEYTAQYPQLDGLVASAPVYIKGYKVGLVETIAYDFNSVDAFTVSVSIDKNISLPRGTQMALVADGLLGGGAIELQLPLLNNRAMPYQAGDTLPTHIEAGLIENLQTGLLANVDSLLSEANQLLAILNNEIGEGSLNATLQNIEKITRDLTISSNDIRQLTHKQLPSIVEQVDSTLCGLNAIVNDVQDANIKQTIQSLDTTIHSVNEILHSTDGTLGLLLNDQALYDNLNGALQNLNQAVLNVDTIVMSIKTRPFIQKKLPKKN